MLGRRCSRCHTIVRTQLSEAGKKTRCPKCGKRYVIARVRKDTLSCPRCTKLLEAPAAPEADIKFRCPYCRVFFRIKPARKTIIDRSALVLDLPDEQPEVRPPAEDTPYYGEAVLVDERAQNRLLWTVLLSAAAVILLAFAGGAYFYLSQMPAATARIRGVIYFGEKPVSAGLVSFIPDGGIAIESAISDAGSYEVDNVPFGEGQISIVVYPEEARRFPQMTTKEKRDFLITWGRRPLTLLPEKYANAQTTPLRYRADRFEQEYDVRLEFETLPPAVKRTPLEEN